MAQNTDSRQLRILRITMNPDVSDAQYHVSAVDLLRDGFQGTAFPIAFAVTAGNPEDIVLGEALPQDVSIIRLTGTIQA